MGAKTWLALATTILLWSSAFPLIRVAKADFSPYEIAFGRYGLASLVLLVIALMGRIRVPDRADLPRLFMTGVLGVTIYNIALNLGMSKVNAGPASFIVNTLPMFTAILSTIFLKEVIRPAGWLGLIVSCGGILLIAIGEAKGALLNGWTFAILAAAFSWSICIVLQKPLLKRYTPLEVVAYSIWSGSLCMAMFLPSLVGAVKAAGPRTIGTLVYLGLFPSVVAYVTWNVVLSKMPASRAASFLYLVPVLSTLIAVALLNEKPSALSLIGGCLALGGVMIINTFGRGMQQGPAPRELRSLSSAAISTRVHE